MKHDFILGPVDTDSISFCKPDMSEFTQEEINILLKEINDLSPEYMDWENDGLYSGVIVAKAKNYILFDGKKKIVKGSSFKSATKSIALKAFINEIIELMLHDQTNYIEVYNRYVKMIYQIKTQEDMKLWATKKTLTDRVLESERLNESKVRDALQDSEYSEGDKFYMFYKSDDSLSLVENFNGEYNTKRLVKALYDTTKTFATIIDHSMFINYSLKRHQKELDILLNTL
jgi:hypothetical protein